MSHIFSTCVFNAHLLKCPHLLWFQWQQFPWVFCSIMQSISPATCQSGDSFSCTCQLHEAMLLCWSSCSSCLGLGVSASKHWTNGLIHILEAKRFSTSARTLPYPNRGRVMDPNSLMPYGFGWFMALIISFWQGSIQLCAFPTGTDSWKWSFPPVCWESESLCVRKPIS